MSCPKENNKADKSNKDLTDILGLTARDIEVLVKAYSCMKETVQIDYKKLADLCSFNSADSASKQWSRTKAKMNKAINGKTEGGSQNGVQPGTPSGASDTTPTPKRKRANKDVDDGTTPSKRSRVDEF